MLLDIFNLAPKVSFEFHAWHYHGVGDERTNPGLGVDLDHGEARVEVGKMAPEEHRHHEAQILPLLHEVVRRGRGLQTHRDRHGVSGADLLVQNRWDRKRVGYW